MNHPFFAIAACCADWTPGVFSKTARKRQIGPNGLLASTARTVSNTCVFAVFCSFRLYVVIGGLPAPSAHQNELFASTACTFSKHVILTIFVKTQPYLVIRVRPAPSFDQYGLLASTACAFLRRPMLIVFECFLKNCAPLQREAPFGSPGLSP